MAKIFSNKQLSKLEQAFSRFQNKDDKINIDWIDEVLRRLGDKVDGKEYLKIVNELEIDGQGSGLLNF